MLSRGSLLKIRTHIIYDPIYVVGGRDRPNNTNYWGSFKIKNMIAALFQKWSGGIFENADSV